MIEFSCGIDFGRFKNFILNFPQFTKHFAVEYAESHLFHQIISESETFSRIYWAESCNFPHMICRKLFLLINTFCVVYCRKLPLSTEWHTESFNFQRIILQQFETFSRIILQKVYFFPYKMWKVLINKI